ncbi:acyl-CoA dehydrogenase [Hephaestia caeni]|uniref:Cyclohexane-1-carbonyl-CoA dehydrogenase n=1 Tax=Hephaestia caeni TaxID=645617 RepID=A0A397NTC7_9SPHN|nr:acyl-CoA dehydrogenase family protein [Hephaestia caeni]RIA37975.1 acyl-CoA dehydrogenase [Hephaestia caeni]
MAMHARPIMDDEDVAIYREFVGRFLDDHAPPETLERWRAAGMVDRGFWLKAGEAGLLCPSAPEELGGAGGDFRHELVVIEEIGRRGLEGFGAPVHNAIVAPYIIHLANEAQRARWVPGMVSGETVLAVGMTEPGAGSDLKAIRTTARRDGDHYVVSGQKTFISNGQTADLIVVACKTHGADGRDGISLLAVETADAPGFERGRNLHKMGREAQDTSELFFDDVRVPAANLLGAEGEGFRAMMGFLPQERLVIAAMGQAMMERAIELTLEHVRARDMFGKKLFDFQNTQFKLAEARTSATVGRAFIDQCLALHLAGALDPVTAAMAKLWVTETECKVIDECVQLFGGYGYMDEYPISRLFRDSRIDRVHGGASEVMKLIIARSL